MMSFIALAWDRKTRDAEPLVQKYRSTLSTPGNALEIRVDLPGFVVATSPSTPVTVSKDAEGGVCALIGRVFSGIPSSPEDAESQGGVDIAAEAIASEGTSLFRRYWGDYVAVFSTGTSQYLLRSPSSQLPCFFYKVDGLTIALSHFEHNAMIRAERFSVNRAFVEKIIVDDTVLDGSTGLEGVGELLGGQRLVVSASSTSQETLWDPRDLAKEPWRFDSDDSAEILRTTTQETINRWAERFTHVTILLSGGLDSSIVLSALRNGGYQGRIDALHYVPIGAQHNESEQARACAAHFGVELHERPVHLSVDLPGIDNHPASARPYRQYFRLGSDIQHELTGPGRAVFTGQGGDHLFHNSTSPKVFADYLLAHGASLAAFAALSHASRLSNFSVQKVLWSTAKTLCSRTTRSRAVQEIEAAHRSEWMDELPQFDAAESLPDWAVARCGVSPAKFDQICDLVQMISIREPFWSERAGSVVHPLISQPIMELCLNIPSFTLAAGGVSRGLARLAHRGTLPSSILDRSSKTNINRLTRATFTDILPQLKDALQGGALVEGNFVSPRKLDSLLDTSRLIRTGKFQTLTRLYAIEAWLRAWKAP